MIRVPEMGRWFAALLFAASPLTLTSHAAHMRAAPPPDRLGLTVADGHRTGAVITSLRSGGPAERGGIIVGDEVHAVDGHRTRTAAAVRHDLRHARHCQVAIDLRRRGNPLVATVRHCRATKP